MNRRILMNVEETDLRVAFLEDGKLSSLQVEPFDDKSIVGNIYKGRVEGIIPGLKAVFVNIGLEKNAFLHFSDVRQEYALPHQGRPTRLAPDSPSSPNSALIIEPTGSTEPISPGKRRSQALEVGDSLIVQATKDEINDKGPRVTTNIALPGRYLVYLPFAESEGGVSRRIENGDERRRLKKMLREFSEAEDGSFIIRTAGLDQEEEAITADVEHLRRQWRAIERKAARSNTAALVHNDHDILFRLVRDSFAHNEEQVIIDDAVRARTLRSAIRQLTPNAKTEVIVYKESKNIFEAYDVDRQIENALKRKVWLKSGGSLIIEETEAMTVIDVNTGKFVGRGDQEDTILRTNLEAAAEVVNQLRIRDIGGIIVVDFIDMLSRKNQDALLREIGAQLKKDRAKSSYTGISEFGLVQITRKRVRQSLSKTVMEPCPYCEGAGRVLSKAEIWRNLKYDLIRDLEEKGAPEAYEIQVHPDIRAFVETEILESVRKLANRYKVVFTFLVENDLHVREFRFKRREAKPQPKASDAGKADKDRARHDSVRPEAPKSAKSPEEAKSPEISGEPADALAEAHEDEDSREGHLEPLVESPSDSARPAKSGRRGRRGGRRQRRIRQNRAAADGLAEPGAAQLEAAARAPSVSAMDAGQFEEEMRRVKEAAPQMPDADETSQDSFFGDEPFEPDFDTDIEDVEPPSRESQDMRERESAAAGDTSMPPHSDLPAEETIQEDFIAPLDRPESLEEPQTEPDVRAAEPAAEMPMAPTDEEPAGDVRETGEQPVAREEPLASAGGDTSAPDLDQALEPNAGAIPGEPEPAPPEPPEPKKTARRASSRPRAPRKTAAKTTAAKTKASDAAPKESPPKDSASPKPASSRRRSSGAAQPRRGRPAKNSASPIADKDSAEAGGAPDSKAAKND